MKHNTQLIFATVILLYVCSGFAFSQSASALWTNTVSVAGNTPTVSGNITAGTTVIRAMGINGYTGGTIATAQRYYSVGGAGTGYWPADTASFNPARYLEYAVAPKTNTNLAVDSIYMNLGDNVGNKTIMVKIFFYVGTDADTSDFISKATQLNVDTQWTRVNNLEQVPTYAPNISVVDGKKLFLRVYPFIATLKASGKYFFNYNVNIKGTTTDIPVPASAMWPLHLNGVATISGLLSGDNINFDGTDLYHYGYNANGDRWTTTLPSKGAWNAETSPNFARYAQFSVGPQTGGTFYPTALSFNMIVEFTTTLRLAVYYSKDSTFTTKTTLADTIVPAAKTMYSYNISDTVASGEKLYVRFYPYNTATNGSYKLVDVDSVIISGATTGLAILAPTVTTTNATYISTTFLTSGGNVTTDGGGAVSTRGVCWNTAGSPTITDSYTTNGTGVGTFASSVTGLTVGTTYHIRAYATNVSGTGYGDEIVVSTLASIVPPTVTTTSVSSILAVTAVSGGNVTDWGGDTVFAKGVCWSQDTTSSYPTLSNSYTVDGTGNGTFISGLSEIIAGTKYFIRAYATNSVGTGYGNLLVFTTQLKAADTTVVVAQDGSGNYTTLQAAFNAVPANYTGKWTIFVKNGKYHEKDTLAAGKVNVILIGEERDSTVIWNADFSDMYGSGKPGTSGTFTITIDADDFIAKNITFENTYWPNRFGTVSGTQGVAVSANGDRQQFINCVFNGYQDTYYARGSKATGRAYHKNCIIRGTVDYIFGRNICVFDSCTIISMKTGGTITAASTEGSSLYGYVFRNCTLVSDTSTAIDSTGFVHTSITSFYLGRPWQASPRTTYLYCNEPATLANAAWTTMSVVPALYAEYNCYGPGFTTTRAAVASWPSANQGRQLTGAEAAMHSLSTIFAKNSASSSLILYDWMPSSTSAADDMPYVITSVEGEKTSVFLPTEFKLNQNYPNPFNPSTTISFDVPKSGMVTLKVYDLLGREVTTLVNGMKNIGTYREIFDGSKLASGIYFARLTTGSFSQVIKLLMTK